MLKDFDQSLGGANNSQEKFTIDLIHNTRHLCTCFRIEGLKAIMSSGILGGKQKMEFGNARNRGRLCLLSQKEAMS